MLEGVTVSAGVALGPVRIGGYELDRPGGVRIPKEQVESEVDRFHGAVERSRRQARDLRESLARDLGKEAQILEVHLAYLEDATFLKDVEDRIRGEQLPLEGALSRIVRDFDRIFELVENELLKERAIDLRDVALRLIRNLDETEPQRPEKGITRPFILATHKLSIVDMFDIDHERVLGVIAEEGGRNSHAGILARSMGIPALTGITGLRDQIRNEDFVILDSSSGVVYVNPETTLRKEYEIRAGESRGRTRDDAVHGRPRLADGLELEVLGSCGNLGDVSHSVSYGLEGIGLYRTELLFLLERSLPDEEKLFDHYREVMTRAESMGVCFRLLDDDGELRIPGHVRQNETNPALGLKGIRLLLAEQTMFRTQLRALLRLGGVLDIAVPFVTSLRDLRQLRRAIREERAELLKKDLACAEKVRLGALVEVPATAFHLGHIAEEADYLIIALDDLQQYLLAADRDNLGVAEYYRTYHPALFRLLEQINDESRLLGKDLTLFGEGVVDPQRLPFYVGLGIRRFSVSPESAAQLGSIMGEWTRAETEELARAVLAAETAQEVERVLLQRQKGTS